jgi:hypothetical protein
MRQDGAPHRLCGQFDTCDLGQAGRPVTVHAGDRYRPCVERRVWFQMVERCVAHLRQPTFDGGVRCLVVGKAQRVDGVEPPPTSNQLVSLYQRVRHAIRPDPSPSRVGPRVRTEHERPFALQYTIARAPLLQHAP